MYKRKNVSKSVSLQWLAFPYQGVWAFGPEDVPIWDESRGFPADRFRHIKLHVVDDAALVPDLVKGFQKGLEDVVVRKEGDTDLEILRKWIGEDWTPQPIYSGRDGFPELVKADYTQPLWSEDRTDVDIVGELAAIARHYPFLGGTGEYDKRLLREVAALNALVGQPRGGTNRLKTWLELALQVRAHFKARTLLDDAGGDIGRFLYELGERDQNWRTNSESQRIFSRYFSPYSGLIFATRGVRTREDVISAMYEDRRMYIGRLEGAILYKQSIAIQVSLWDWAQYRVLEVWSEGADLRACAGCGRHFLARRRGQKHCHPRCRVRAFDLRRA